MSHEPTDEDKKRHAAMVALSDEVLALLDEIEGKANAKPDAIRMRRMRRRRKLGVPIVPVEISEEAVELLRKRGYVQQENFRV
jgi:hypothetical protein